MWRTLSSRGARGRPHVAAAAWLESKAPGRVEDHADVLAYHYATAFDLAQAAGQGQQATDLEASALRFLGLAGERALGLDTKAALASFERALALTPTGHPDRAAVLARFGEAAFHAGRMTEAVDALEEATTAFRARDDLLAAARAMGSLSNVLYRLGDARWADLPPEAVALLEPLPPGPEFVSALTELARAEGLQGSAAAAVGHAEQALALADELGLRRPARALGYLGLARCDLGDRAGLDDYREGIALATEVGQGRDAGLIHANLGETLWVFEGAEAALESMRAGIAYSKDRGLVETVNYITGSTLDPLYGHGAFDEALEVAAGIEGRVGIADVTAMVNARAARARILVLRGEVAEVADSLEWLESTSREAGAPDYAVIGLVSAALARAALGQDKESATLLAELLTFPGARDMTYYAVYLPTMVRTALGLGDRNLAERLVAGYEPRYPITVHALATANAALAEAQGDLEVAAEGYAEAAAGWRQFGVAPERAFALLGRGRCLAAMRQVVDSKKALRAAAEIFSTLGAASALSETDELLRQATAIGA
jgi:tetratricopeptide (TPR) repeat protein